MASQPPETGSADPGPAASAPTGAGRSGRSRIGGLLGLLVVVGAALRTWGILHGLSDGLVYHPDAYYVVHDAWEHALGAPWSEGHFGPVYGALVQGALHTAEAAGRFLGMPVDWTFAMIGVVASAVAAALGTVTILAVYLLGARAYGRGAGVVAASLLAVDPLHGFQSHYPYRDVPMTLALTLVLAGAVAWAVTTRWPWLALAGLGAVAAAALKTTGFLVVVPLLAALALAWRHVPRWLAVAALAGVGGAVLAGVWLHGIPTLPGLPPAVLDDPFAVGRDLGRFVLAYLEAFGGGVGAGLPVAMGLLLHWLGPAALGVAVAGVVRAGWRRRPADLVLLAFVVPAFLAAAMFRWLDERYLVPLLPALWAMAGGVTAAAWGSGRGRWPVRIAVTVALAVALGGGLIRSAWQGRILALPDTRALAAGWLEAHVSRTTPLLAEPYAPLGLETWPDVQVLDPTRPAAPELARAPLLITSTLEHQRYLDFPERYPGPAAFFESLAGQARRVKTVALAPLGFVNPTIAIYETGTEGPGATLSPDLPRPFDDGWNRGIAQVERGPYDRDDRAFVVTGGRPHAVTLVSRERLERIRAIVANGDEVAEIRLRVAGRERRRALGAGEVALIDVASGWTWSRPPVLTPVDVSLRPDGASALVQLRTGARETGLGAAEWGRWAEAAPALRAAVASRPADVPAGLRLVRALRETGATDAARAEAVRLLSPGGPAARDIAAYRRLAAQPVEPAAAWDAGFARETGLSAVRLRYALGIRLPVERLRVAGRLAEDEEAAEGWLVAGGPGARPRGAAGVVILNGPEDLLLPTGHFVARLAIRAVTRSGADPGAVALLRIFEETRLVAETRLRRADLAGGAPADPFTTVAVPFRHERPAARVAVQVEALEPLEVRDVRLEPDLPGTMRAVGRALDELAGG